MGRNKPWRNGVHSDFWYLINGMFVGCAVAAPIGPIAILCIRQTLTHGFFMGIICGIAVSIADGFYSIVAALGANLVNGVMETHGQWFYLFGGALLTYIGQKIFRTEIEEGQGTTQRKREHVGAFIYTLFLTLASPMTTLLFVAAFTAAHVFEDPLSTTNIAFLGGGVFLGALLWWTFLSSVVTFIKRRLDFKVFLIINKISGLGILGFGLYTLTKIFS